MESLTRLLKRQLKKAFGSPENIPEGLNELIMSVNQSYIHYESDRALLERTMEISSTELFESNKRLIDEAKKHRKLVAQLKETIMEISSDAKVFEDDDILHVAEILQSEIKKRQIAEQAIATSEEKYRGIIENMELGMLETDSEGRVTKVYEQFSNITGYSAKDLLGKKSMDVLVEKADKPKAILELETRNQKRGNVYELAVNCKDGSTKWMLVSGAPVYGENGEVIGTVGIHFDITKRKETENELIAAREDAEKLLRIRDQFLANVSHEIRTPMNAVIGMTNLLQDSDINTEQSEYLNAIDVSAKGLLVIINDILDMSKINSGKFSIESIDFNLDHVLKNLMAGLQIKAEEKGIYLQCSRDPRISRFLKGDPTRLNQVLINLCSNAIKFTETGGVTIEIKYLGTSNSKDKIEFRIIDTGKGIAPEKLNTIFDSFSQEDDTITRNYGGTGLGLTISKQIIGFFDSDLKVQSTIGMGSEFHFTLEMPHGGQVAKKESVSAPKSCLLKTM
ncbi:MAG: PAS domain-containing sensor histidine kinase [Flavobacteriales bacterium]